jgi:hypothetical protein
LFCCNDDEQYGSKEALQWLAKWKECCKGKAYQYDPIGVIEYCFFFAYKVVNHSLFVHFIGSLSFVRKCQERFLFMIEYIGGRMANTIIITRKSTRICMSDCIKDEIELPSKPIQKPTFKRWSINF